MTVLAWIASLVVALVLSHTTNLTTNAISDFLDTTSAVLEDLVFGVVELRLGAIKFGLGVETGLGGGHVVVAVGSGDVVDLGACAVLDVVDLGTHASLNTGDATLDSVRAVLEL